MLNRNPDLLTIRVRELDGDYQVNTWQTHAVWRNDTACRESLHRLLVQQGYKRIVPGEDGDPLTGEYRRYATAHHTH